MNSPLFCLNQVEWRGANEERPEETGWSRNASCPREGEIRWCQVHLETNEQLNWGHKRWLLYQTGTSLFNGIGSAEDLDALAIVEAEVLDVATGDESSSFQVVSQWWQVRCARVIPLADIPERLPPLPPLAGDDFRPRGHEDCASNRLALYSWGTQVIETKIYVKDERLGAPKHLVFYEMTVGDKCEIYNWPVK